LFLGPQESKIPDGAQDLKILTCSRPRKTFMVFLVQKIFDFFGIEDKQSYHTLKGVVFNS